jgi:hypothetical protein
VGKGRQPVQELSLDIYGSWSRYLWLLVRSDRIRLWSEERISRGDPWLRETQAAIERAAMAVFLARANFLASRFCAEVEMREFVLRQRRKGMRVVGVPLSHCPWEHEPWLAELQMLPQSEARRLTPIDEFTSQPNAWTQVVGEIAKLLPPSAVLGRKSGSDSNRTLSR